MRRSITAFAVLAAAVVMLALGGASARAAQSHGAPSSPDAKAAGVRTGAFSLRVSGTNWCARPTGVGEGSAVVLEKCNFVDGNKHLQWWWVENGKVSHPVRNLRFNQSVLAMLAPWNVEAVGEPRRLSPYMVPPLKLGAFTFTSISDAI